MKINLQKISIRRFIYVMQIYRDRYFPENAIRNIIYQVLQGLSFMHKNGKKKTKFIQIKFRFFSPRYETREYNVQRKGRRNGINKNCRFWFSAGNSLKAPVYRLRFN